MVVTRVNNYSAVYENSASAPLAEPNRAENAQLPKGAGTEKYLVGLQKRNPQINISVGAPAQSMAKSTGKTDVRIAPNILRQMAADSEAANKYEEMLSQIPALDRWANSMIKAMTGNEVKYRQVWIDENGNMGSFCISGPSDNPEKRVQTLQFMGMDLDGLRANMEQYFQSLRDYPGADAGMRAEMEI